MAIIGNNIEKAIHLLRDGELVAIPTETVYGLAANALNEKAVLSVFSVKERPAFDPLIIHVHAISEVLKYAEAIPEKLMVLAKKFWPGPLTLLLTKKAIVPDLVTSGLPQVAVRIPDHPITLALLKEINLPLAAPSANPFGYISPTDPAHVDQQLGHKIKYILDGGPCKVGLESTIVGMENDEVVIYRLGGISIENIEREIGQVRLHINLSGDPKAPGQLKSHYAPRKPLYVGDVCELSKIYGYKKTSLILFGNTDIEIHSVKTYQLSATSNTYEAALKLFKILHDADADASEIVIAPLLPETGLGPAINDRLKRASVQ